MVTVHDYDAPALLACACVYEHRSVPGILYHSSDRCGISSRDTEYPLCRSYIPESYINKLHKPRQLPLYKILDLLTHLFDQILHEENTVGDLDIVCL